MKKRIVCLLLAVVIVFAMLPTAFAAEPAEGLANFKKVNTYTEGQFSDVKSGQWYAANVKASYEMGLVLGKGDGSFGVNDPVTLATAITLAARIHSIYHTGSANFVQGKPWYQVYVDYAIANGIIEAGEYSNYNVNATRAQFSKILAASVPESALRAINDIVTGEVHDLPGNTEYAEAAYLLYNAGVITGTDGYGTFKANAEIMRSEAVTITTRVVDTTLRKVFEPQNVAVNPPEGLSIRNYRDVERSELAIGQLAPLTAQTNPEGAVTAITWTSSNPEVAAVNDRGEVTALKQGTAIITATTWNGVQDTFEIAVPNGPAELQYALTADGTGYEIIGCDAGAYAPHIPATYNGLPVVSIRGGVFKDCENLRYFTVEPAQTTFYAEGGVLFTDIPEKTLVAFPCNYDFADNYYVPADTVAVAPYAFAGIHTMTLKTITMQEGLIKLGDRAFLEAHWQYMVYLPDSLTEIGNDLLQGQTSNVAFYAHPNTAIEAYARKNNIPFGPINPFEGKMTDVEMKEPVSLPVSEATLPDSKNIVYVPESYHYNIGFFDSGDVSRRYDLSAYEETTDGEVRLMLETQWSEIIPDVNGKTRADFPAQTGLYGAGYTDGPAILRAYDRLGNLVGWQRIDGDFAFSFPGAYNLGVEGGTETQMTVLPVKPIFISDAGYLRVVPEEWIRLSDGNIAQHFIIQMQYPMHTMQFSMDTSLFSYSFVDAATGETTYRDGSSRHYGVARFFSHDASRADQMEVISIHFDGLECIWEDEDILCMMSRSLNLTKEYGQNLSRILQRVKETMVGTYFPEAISIRQIMVDSMSSWNPNASMGNISLPADSAAIIGEETLAHEMVHAIDQQIPMLADGPYAPSPWFEGRAEYIGNIVMGGDGTPKTFDWSYLSEEDRADFFHYYYYSTNRWTEYDVGHHFFYYLCKTYGEDVSEQIMANIAALPIVEDIPSSEITSEMEEQWAQMFKQCVEAATEVDVFQNFVRDVIEK